MDSNPYKASVATEPPKATTRQTNYWDIAGIIAGGMPLMFIVMMFVIAPIMSFADGQRSEIAIGIGILLIAFFFGSVAIWFVGGIYNTVAIIRGRRLPIAGIALNVLSLAVWGFIVAVALLTNAASQ